MARWLNTLDVICADAEREKEFSGWYDNVHLADILKTPGFLNGRRCEMKEFRDGRGKFVTMYEIETDDMDKTIAVRVEKRAKEIEQGRGSTAFIIVWKDVLWRQIAKLVADKEHDPRKQRWVNLVETNCGDASREQEFNDWYTNTHLPDVLETPGFMAATRYEMKEFRDGRGKYFTLYEIETDDIDKTMAVRVEKRVKEVEQGRGSKLWAPVWRDVLCRVVTERAAAK